MQAQYCILLLLVLAVHAQPPAYAPGPQQDSGGPIPPYSHAGPPAPPSDSGPAPAPSFHSHAPAKSPVSSDLAPSPSTKSPEPAPEPSAPPEYTRSDVAWCAVRDEYEPCLNYTSVLSTPQLSWTCVLRGNKELCMEAIKNGDAHIMSLEAGLAYVAFLNHSMKAILAEQYTYHAESYGAVAVVNKEMCDKNPALKLEDFKTLKSCHSGYLTAAGWNYLVQALLNPVSIDPGVLNETISNDVKVVASFFSASCAPSELEEGGICSGCGTGDNSSFCSSAKNEYAGEDGAFRCLMEGRGDIAFIRAKTPTLYASDGLNSQPWSSKSVNEFMYLCPTGGCQSINDNYGSCQLASVPANVVMTQNNLPDSQRQAIIKTLLAANWTNDLYTGRNWQNYLLSVSTQGLGQVNILTRQYLGTSGTATQTVMDLQSNRIQLNVTSSAVQIFSVPVLSLSFALGTLTASILFTFHGIL